MVDKEIVLQTVKKMYESGIDDDVVQQTLKDIGLSPAEAKQFMAEAKGSKPQMPKEEPKPLEERMAFAEERPDQAALHTTTHVALEAQNAKTSELLDKVANLERRLAVSAAQSPGSNTLANERLASIEKNLKDLKAELSATKAIMEKILETNRRVLNKL